MFDQRVTVDKQLQKGQYDQCHACRMPIIDSDKKSKAYVEGVSCPHCIDKQSEAQRQRFREREKQVRLARARNQTHIGTDAIDAQENNGLAKQELRKVQKDRRL